MKTKGIATDRRAFRVAELVESLGVPKATVYRWIASGRLGSIRIGRVVLVPASALESLLKHDSESEGN